MIDDEIDAGLAAQLESLQALRAKRDAVMAGLDDLIETKRKLLDAAMRNANRQTVKCTTATAYYQKDTRIEVADWNAVMDYVYKNKAWDVLQKRIAPAALELRMKNGAKIAGVTVTNGSKLAIRSVKEKGESDADS